jgi:hypothetical protein
MSVACQAFVKTASTKRHSIEGVPPLKLHNWIGCGKRLSSFFHAVMTIMIEIVAIRVPDEGHS